MEKKQAAIIESAMNILLIINHLEQGLFKQDLELCDIQDGIEDGAVAKFNVVSKDVGKSPPTADPTVDCLVPCSSIRLHLLVQCKLSSWTLKAKEAVSVAAIDNHLLTWFKLVIDARLGNLRVGPGSWKGSDGPHDPARFN
jgi:hypothetical protein